jgi:hypothetical protein
MGALDALEDRAAEERRVLSAQLALLSHRLTPEHLAQEALEAAIRGVTGRLSRHRATSAGSTLRAALPLAAAMLGGVRRPRPDHPTDTYPITQQQGDLSMTDHLHDDTDTHSRIAEGASQAPEKANASLDALRARIDQGLDDLPEEARLRVRRAREAAMNARAEVEAKTRMAADAARGTARENPLLIGALAFAAGAALAAALPRTSVENRTIGAQRDQLFDEAERIYREERAKLAEAAQQALDAGRASAEAALADDKEGSKSAA